jgi:hypothetical protein
MTRGTINRTLKETKMNPHQMTTVYRPETLTRMETINISVTDDI